jgi:hypothetical protein
MTLIDVAVYGLAGGSMMSTSLMDYLFHVIASDMTLTLSHMVNYTLLALRDDARGLVPGVSLFVQETCGVSNYLFFVIAGNLNIIFEPAL